MEKTELLKKLSELRPGDVERIIAQWGSAGFAPCVDRLAQDAARVPDAVAGATLGNLLLRLRELHDREYPALAAASLASAGERLAGSADFALVNARFPHIGAKLSVLWGSAACDAYIDQLLNDTRGGSRQGFPAEVASALLRLSLRHSTEHPSAPSKPSRFDAWELS